MREPAPGSGCSSSGSFPGNWATFWSGLPCTTCRDRLPGRWGVLVAVALATLVVIRATADPIVTLLFDPLALGILVIYAATAVPHLGNFARFGDFSYGIYIIHFPVVQALVASGLFARDPWAAFWSSLALVAVLSALSWHAIERPFLRRHSHYRLAETGAGGTT